MSPLPFGLTLDGCFLPVSDGKKPDLATKGTATTAARHRDDALFHTGPDERLAYMETPEWDFSTGYFEQENRVLNGLPDVTAGREGRRLAEPMDGRRQFAPCVW